MPVLFAIVKSDSYQLNIMIVRDKVKYPGIILIKTEEITTINLLQNRIVSTARVNFMTADTI